jgi:hypothetical protein
MLSETHKKYVVTCYYYCSGEPDDSSISVFGCYSTREEAKEAMMNRAKKDMQNKQNDEEEMYEEIRRQAKDENWIIKETDKEIYTEAKNGSSSATIYKSFYEVRIGLRGLIVGNFKDDENNNDNADYYHYGGYDGAGDFLMYDIEIVNELAKS